MQHTTRLALALALALVMIATALAAQDGDPVFSDVIDVRVVNVEVLVLDKQGEPITGLTRDDFEILEDGEPMELVNFYPVEGTTAHLDAGSVASSVSGEMGSPELPSGSTQGLNLVVFIDNLHIRPENRKLLFEKLRKRLEEPLVPGSRIMLAAMGNRVEVLHPFTEEIDQVLAALDQIEKHASLSALMDGDRRMFMSRLARASTYGINCNRTRPPGSPGGGAAPTDPKFDSTVREAQNLAVTIRNIAEQRYQVSRASINSLSAFSETLGGLPGRKAMLYLSDGIPVRPADSFAEAWIAKFDLWYQQNEGAIRNCSNVPEAIGDLQRALTGSSSSNFDLHSEFTRLTERASDNRVAFYPISNGGRGSSFISASNPSSSDGSSQMMRNAMVADRISRDASVLQMADDTGGRAFTGNANIGELIDRAGQDFSHFYSLGYTPPERKPDNAFHKIKVKVHRDGAKTRHIKGYQDKNWRDRLGDMTIAAALYDLEANPLGIQLQAGEMTQQGNRFKVPVMVQIPFRKIAMLDNGEKADAKLSLLVVVRDDQGGFSQPRRFDLPISIPSAQVAQAREQAAAYPLELDMKKGDQRVAIGIRDHIGQTSSTLKLDFDTGSSDPPKKGKKGKKSKKRSKG